MLKITVQEIFDAAWQAFVVENKPASMGSIGFCAYRGDGGSRCAIGLCIPDEYYDRKLEGLGPFDIENGDCGFNITFEDDVTAGEAQSELHDDISHLLGSDDPTTRNRVKDIYLGFADRHDLTVPE